MPASHWFEVSKDGLAKIMSRKSPAFALFELVQNAWDTSATEVNIKIEAVRGQALVSLYIEDDDPTGFSDLAHAFTLFAESKKKGDPTTRGRFNLGEKLVLAMCQSAEITSTTGRVTFDANGRHQSRIKREGSSFHGYLRMTREQVGEMLHAASLLLPPIPTTLNGIRLTNAAPIKTFEVTLPTEMSDAEGFIRRTARKTKVRVYACSSGQPSRIYEMGIPVVETDDPWSVEVMQKIPINMDRDNVPPAYLRELRVAVVNAMKDQITKDNAATTMVQEALGDSRIDPQAVAHILDHQFGSKRAVFDPRDQEANAAAVAHGYTVIPGSAYSKSQWSNIRSAEALVSSGKLFPTPKPYSDDPNARLAKVIPEEKWTPGMRETAEYARDLAWRLISKDIRIVMEVEPMASYGANYGHQTLTFNVGRLGRDWFNHGVTLDVNDLILHELGHEFESNHLSAGYHKALTRLGAKLAQLVLSEPTFFTDRGMKSNKLT
jgi:hypothetical protein